MKNKTHSCLEGAYSPWKEIQITVANGLSQPIVGLVSAGGLHGSYRSVMTLEVLSVRNLDGHIIFTMVMLMQSTKYVSPMKPINHNPLAIVHESDGKLCCC